MKRIRSALSPEEELEFLTAMGMDLDDLRQTEGGLHSSAHFSRKNPHTGIFTWTQITCGREKKKIGRGRNDPTCRQKKTGGGSLLNLSVN
jgi:hypothetical protein